MSRPDTVSAIWPGSSRVIDAGVLTHTVMDNYHWDSTPVAVRLRPMMAPWSKMRSGSIGGSDSGHRTLARLGPDPHE
jgi:hypothetical protein